MSDVSLADMEGGCTVFSVDVETSGTNPYTGVLFTIGACAARIGADGETDLLPSDEDFYIRIDQSAYIEERSWDTTTGFCSDPNTSYPWWLEQSDLVKGEAWLDGSKPRWRQRDAMERFGLWVREVEPREGRAIFVADPATFDFAWIQSAFEGAGFADPFHYSTIDLRSMRWALTPWSGWVNMPEPKFKRHRSATPHHALFDAKGQMLTLISMLTHRDGLPNDSEVMARTNVECTSEQGTWVIYSQDGYNTSVHGTWPGSDELGAWRWKDANTDYAKMIFLPFGQSLNAVLYPPSTTGG